MALKDPDLRDRVLGAETKRSHRRRQREGFYDRFLSGDKVLDIGFRGGTPNAVPVTEKALGIELDYPGYDGINLPFDDHSQDAVFASHTLEHIRNWKPVLADWFRVLKVGGYLIIAVPHRFLYERKANLPSRFNGDHKRFYTANSLLSEVEDALPPACWRLRSLRDVDDGFDYDLPPEVHPKGCYEVELVVEKIKTPEYVDRLIEPPHADKIVQFEANLITDAVAARISTNSSQSSELERILFLLPLPAFNLLERYLPRTLSLAVIKDVMRPWIRNSLFDEADYLDRHRDVDQAVAAGRITSGLEHYVQTGYFEGRFALPESNLFR